MSRSDRAVSTDRFGFDDNRNYLTSALAKLVPRGLAHRGVAVTVDVERERYAAGEPVRFTVALRNRLPVPIEVATPTRRLWGWTVDGELEASDERVFQSSSPGVLTFRGGERKVVTRTWNGRFKRTGEPTRWVEPDPGTYELGAFVNTAGRPSDAVEIRID